MKMRVVMKRNIYLNTIKIIIAVWLIFFKISMIAQQNCIFDPSIVPCPEYLQCYEQCSTLSPDPCGGELRFPISLYTSNQNDNSNFKNAILQELNTFFISANIEFYICEENVLPEELVEFQYNCNVNDWDMVNNINTGTIAVYIVESIDDCDNDTDSNILGGTNHLGGNCVVINTQQGLISLNSITKTTIHEFGHLFGLRHTWDAVDASTIPAGTTRDFGECYEDHDYNNDPTDNTINIISDGILDTEIGIFRPSNDFPMCPIPDWAALMTISSCDFITNDGIYHANYEVSDLGACAQPGFQGIDFTTWQNQISNMMNSSSALEFCGNTFSPCQLEKMYDIAKNCKDDICPQRIATPNIVNNYESTYIFDCDIIPSLQATTTDDEKRLTNCNNITWEVNDLVVMSGSALFDFDSFVDSNGPGDYEICFYEVGIYNTSCRSPEDCITIKIEENTCENCPDNCSCGLVDGSITFSNLNCINGCFQFNFEGDLNENYEAFIDGSLTPRIVIPGPTSQNQICLNEVQGPLVQIDIFKDGDIACNIVDFIPIPDESVCDPDCSLVANTIGIYGLDCDTDCFLFDFEGTPGVVYNAFINGSSIQQAAEVGSSDNIICIQPGQTQVSIKLVSLQGVSPCEIPEQTFDLSELGTCPPDDCTEVLDVSITTQCDGTDFDIIAIINTPGTYDITGIPNVGSYGSGSSINLGTVPNGTQLTINIIDPTNQTLCPYSEFVTENSCTVTPPNCDLSVQISEDDCDTPGLNFSITIAGTGTYQVNDGVSIILNNLNAGTHSINLPSGTTGSFIVIDLNDNSCFINNLTFPSTCNTNPVCDLIVDQISTECSSDETVSIFYTISGSSMYDVFINGVQINQNPLAAGPRSAINIPSGSNSILTVTDVNDSACTFTSSNISQNCTIDPSCDFVLDDINVVCDGSVFNINVVFSGSGQYNISGNGASSVVSAGSYNIGPFNSGVQVTMSIMSTSFSDCGTVVSGLTESCTVQCNGSSFSFPNDIEIDCGDSIEPANTGEVTTNCNACDIQFVDLESDFGGCNGTGSIIRQWIYTDECGDIFTNDQEIEIEDNDGPSINAPNNFTLDCGSDISELEEMVTASDNCDPNPFLTNDWNPGFIDVCLGATNGLTITWRATDNCGNTTFEQTTIFILPDTDPPVITAPQDITIGCDRISDTFSPAAIIDSLLAEIIVEDNCDHDPVINHDFNSAELDICAAVPYDIEITWTAVDDCENQATPQVTRIRIEPDNTDPVIVPPVALMLTCEDISATTDPSLLIKEFCEGATATDDCDTEILITHDFEGDILDICEAGSITINFTATDNCGNTHTLPSTITIDNDGEEPEFLTEPSSLDLDCNEINETTALTIEGWLNAVTISDECDSNPSLTHDYTTETLDICDPAGASILVTWTAKDACGNMDIRTATITVSPDVTPPEFIVEPSNLTLDCEDINETTAVIIEGWLNNVSVFDICDTDPELSHNFTMDMLDVCDPAGTSVLVTWTATDACNNEDTRTATLQVNPDVTPPDLTVPEPLTITCQNISDIDDPAALIAAFLTSASATDFCDTDPVITHDYTGTAIDVCTAQLITVTFTATDACMNAISIASTIEIIPDVTAPEIPVGGILGGGTDFYTCEANVVISVPVPTDACGVTDYSYTVVNPDGSSDGPFDLAVIDNLGGGNTVHEFEEGQSTVIYYAEDACGNLATERVSVFVIDDLDPYFADCHATIVVANDPDQCAALVNWDTPIAFDNCDTPDGLDANENEITVVPDSSNPYATGDNIPVGGPYEITYVATDDDGNMATCTFDIIVNDTECPEFITTLPEDITVDCHLVPEPFEIIPAWHLSDNCTASEDITADFLEVRTDGNCPFDYELKRTWTITDESNNSCVYNQLITVIDTIAPILTLPEDTRIESCPIGFDTIMVPRVIILDTISQLVAVGDEWVFTPVVIKKDTFDLLVTPIYMDPTEGFQAEVSDLCSEEENIIITVTEEIEFVCKGIKAAIVWRIYEAEDECGNITIDTQRIEVLDPNPPVLQVFDTVTVSLGAEGHVDLQRDDIAVAIFDACFGDDNEITTSISPNYFNCSDIGQHTVLVSATDPCNNMTAYEQVVVNIIDDTAPVLNCPTGPINISVNPFNCDGTFDNILNILGGNDCNVTLTTSPPLDASIDFTTDQITVIATDASGNVTTCLVDVSITLTEPIDFDVILACNDRVNVSLNEECWLELEPDIILEGNPSVCTDLLCIEVTDSNGDDHLNFFEESDIGQVFTVRVVDCNGSGNSCWAEINLEEKQIPQIVWPVDTSLLCVEPTDPEYFKLQSPQIQNCEPVIDIEFEDEYVEYDRCADPRATITRKWTVTDDEGNVAIDTQYIDILPFSTEHVLFPNDITIEDPINCKLVTESIDDIENNILDPASRLHPDSTGLPSLFGIPLLSNSGLCLIGVGYDDNVIEVCGGSFSILRTWEVLDLCSEKSETNPLEHTQIITVFDEDGPELAENDIPGDQQYSYSPWSCQYSGPLPVTGMTDVCGAVYFDAYVTGGGYVEIEGSLVNEDLLVTAIGFEEGNHWVTYVYKDDCDNISLYKFVVTIIDELEPVALCQNGITLTVTTDGVANINSDDIDAGSHDAGCDPVNTCLVRMVDFEAGSLGNIQGVPAYIAVNDCTFDGEIRDTVFDKLDQIESIEVIPYVLCKDDLKICCSDLGDMTVVLHAIDSEGLSNICMAAITVTDKSNATLQCEPHEISCTEDKDIDVQSPSRESTNCGTELSLKYVDENEFSDACGEGQVFRIWYLDQNNNDSLDVNEVNCNQVINVTNTTPFDPFSIKWPKHYTGEVIAGKNLECDEDDNLVEFSASIPMGEVFACAVTDPGDFPLWCNTSCGLVGVSSDIDTVTAGDACLKIIKRWTVIDWCYWETNGDSPSDYANDTDNDSFEPVEDWAQGICAGCPDNLSVDPVYFRYLTVDLDGYYTYDQVIKVVDDQSPTIEVQNIIVNTTGGAESKDDDTLCTGTDILTANASDACGENEISGDLLSWTIQYDNGTSVELSNYTGPAISFETQEGSPGDVHTISYTVADGCGNSQTAQNTVTFGDDKNPVPLCVSGVTTAFMETDGTVAVWAEDFDLGSFDNCTDVSFSIVHSGGDPDSARASITFDCDDLETFYELDVYVTDENGNQDFCTVSVLIGGTCHANEQSSAIIAGSLFTEFGEMIEDAEVSIHSTSLSEYPKSISTQADGVFAFANNPTNVDYEITASKDGDYLNGISTADILAIQLHIAGIKLLDTPYQLIAADVNNDQLISAIDLISLRNVLLGNSRRFSNNTSWRFVDEQYEFENVNNPWPFTEIMTFSNLLVDQMSENFIGVKVGDVNNSSVANSVATTTTRSNQNIFLVTEDQEFITGDKILVDINTEKVIDLTGFQFTLEHQGLELNSVEAGAVDLSSQNIGIHNQMLTVSWETIDAIQTDEVLFTLVFDATTSGKLSNVLNTNSNNIKAELYTANNDETLDLEFNTRARYSSVILNQNDPNPFDNQTQISFSFANTQEAELNIYDTNGILMYSSINEYSAGKHQITIDKSILKEYGVYFYTLKTSEIAITKKMVNLR